MFETYANGLLNGCILSPETVRSLSKVHNPDADLVGFINDWQAKLAIICRIVFSPNGTIKVLPSKSPWKHGLNIK